MRQYRILAVDDDERILNFLKHKFKGSGYEVLTAASGAEALQQVETHEPDLILLDLVMPGMDGFETLERLRRVSDVPVMIVSARGADADKISGLNLGADDYIAKPFNPSELVARIEAIRRRSGPVTRGRTKWEPLVIGDVEINFERRAVRVGGEETKLTRAEWSVLRELAENAGRLMLYEDLLTRIWGLEYRDDLQILRTWVSRLNRKLRKGPDIQPFIRCIPKTGYIIDYSPE